MRLRSRLILALIPRRVLAEVAAEVAGDRLGAMAAEIAGLKRAVFRRVQAGQMAEAEHGLCLDDFGGATEGGMPAFRGPHETRSTRPAASAPLRAR